MKKVTKVSIGGLSFTIEEQAYDTIDAYINTLYSHYKDNPNGNEIIDDIEKRMAELFIDHGCKDGIISSEIADLVIGEIGKPEEIFSGQDGASTEGEDEKCRKRMYRNPDDKVIGGVCGGLGAYFNIDPAWLRIAFTALTVLSCVINRGWYNPAIFPVLYLILWICIPLAVTTAQKCAMRGETLKFGAIEHKFDNNRERKGGNAGGNGFWSFIGKIIAAAAGCILLITGLSGFLALFAVLFGVAIMGFAIPTGLLSAMAFVGCNAAWMVTLAKILCILAVFLPFVGMLYGGIMVLFHLKSPKCRPGLIIFIAWIVSLLCLAGIGIRGTSRWWHHQDRHITEVVSPASDTLHICFADVDKWKDKKVLVEGDWDKYRLYFYDDTDRKNASVALYPRIDIDWTSRDDIQADFRAAAFRDGITIDEVNRESRMDFYSFSNDTLTLNPCVLDKSSKVRELGHTVRLDIPEGTKVIISEPVPHDFTTDFEFTNIDILTNCFDFGD